MHVINGIKILFWIGDIVYLKTDADQRGRLVTGIDIRPAGVSYQLSCSTGYSSHFDIEISTERDLLKLME